MLSWCLVVTAVTTMAGVSLPPEVGPTVGAGSAEPSVSVAPASVVIDQEVTATVVAAPDGAQLDWGDGTPPVPLAAGDQTPPPHQFAAGGVYTVSLLGTGSSVLYEFVVEVLTPTLTVDAATAVIDQQVTATVVAAPDGARLDWGDGTVVTLAGAEPHAYAAAGTYTVSVLRSGGTPLTTPVTATVTVGTPTLTLLDDEVLIGSSVTATVANAPFNGELDWGDGTVEVVAEPDGEHTHTYANVEREIFAIELRRAPEVPGEPGVVVAGPASVTVDECDRPAAPEIVIEDNDVVLGDSLTIEVRIPTGLDFPLAIDWGDGSGATGTVDNHGSCEQEFVHDYPAAGTFTITLTHDDGSPVPGPAIDTADVVVTDPTPPPASPVEFTAPATATVGTPVTVSITDLAGNAPDGARLDWGDGSSDDVAADGSFTHVYRSPGPKSVRLLRLPDETVLASATIGVTATGTLEVPDEFTLFTENVIAATDLVPGFQYRLDLGAAGSADLTSDADGRIELTTVIDTPLSSIDVRLRLIDGGQNVQLDRAVVATALPASSETMTATVTPRLADGEFDIDVALAGLIPGLTYVVSGDGIGEGVATAAPDGTATVTVPTSVEGDIVLHLAVRLPTLTGGFTDIDRTSTTVTTAWPSGTEALALENAATPLLPTDTVTVVASGLHPQYGYDLVVNGDTQRPYRLAIGEVPNATVEGEWQIELFLGVVGSELHLELFARRPATTAAPTSRATLTAPVVTPTGTLSTPDPVLPYGVLTPVLASQLVPGLAYRVGLPDGTVQRFVAPDSGEHTIEYRFFAGNTVPLYVDRPSADDQPLFVLRPSGITFVGELTSSFDVDRYLESGEITLHVSDTAPDHQVRVDLGDDRTVEGRTDASGRVDLDAIIETPQQLRLYLYWPAGDQWVFVGSHVPDLPPRTIYFSGTTQGWRVRVTSYDSAPGGGLVSGEGLLENFVLGGRLQDPVPMRFDDVDLIGPYAYGGTADLIEPFEPALPFAVNGVDLTLSTLQLGAWNVRPEIGGEVTLPTGEEYVFDDVLMPAGRPGDGFIITVAPRGPGAPVGASDWRYAAGTGIVSNAVVDLSTYGNYNLRNADGTDALQNANAAYAEAGLPSPLAALGARWVGVLYPAARLSLGGTGSDEISFVGDLAWTSAGPTTYIHGTPGEGGELSLGGWDFFDITGLELLIVDGQVLRFESPTALVHLDFFGTDMPVSFQIGESGQWSVRTETPVAVNFGSTAVVGGVGAFVSQPGGDLVLRFPNALWALDGDLASDPSTIDGSAGTALLDGLPQPLLGENEEVRELYDNSLATAETALNLFQLQLLLKDLTLTADGGISLGGDDWKTLVDVPGLDMFGFPYLGAGAEIGVARDGGSYRIGLRGELQLAEIVRASAAPSWYIVEDGVEQEWRFEGIGVSYGQYEGSPVTFGLTVGGVIDLQSDSLSFTGSGSLVVGEKLSVEATALFGVVDGGGSYSKHFWYVGAGVDLAQMNTPVIVNINGVDVFGFYAFRGGIASNLRIDVGDGDCRIDDGNPAELILPSVATNALDCYDPNLPISFTAGTVVGSPGRAGPMYGRVWHIDADMVVNLGAGGDLQIAGKGWIGKTLDEGYRSRGATPQQLGARLVVNAGGITGTMCAGPAQVGGAALDCSGLARAMISAAGLRVVEYSGVAQFKASWSTGQYYFALGTVNNPLAGYVIPAETSGYLIAGYVSDPGVLSPNVTLPAGGIWVGAGRTFGWSYSDSGTFMTCDWSAWASASFGFGGGFSLQFVPQFSLGANVTLTGSATAGASGCGISADVGASIIATGRFRAPTPTEFRGDFAVKIWIPVIPDIEVTVENVGVTL